MTVATIIPSWNEPQSRLETAVASALEVSDFVVVADDGSRPPVSLLDDRAHVVYCGRLGPAGAMNAGVERALSLGATRICRLDVGDHFRRDAKLRQLEHTEPAVMSPHFDLVTNAVFNPPPHWQTRVYTDGAFCIGTMAISAEVWHEVGGFDHTLRYGDDWDFAMRVQHAIGWTLFPEVTCEAGAFDGGHTKAADADPIKRQLKHECLKRCIETGKRLRRA